MLQVNDKSSLAYMNAFTTEDMLYANVHSQMVPGLSKEKPVKRYMYLLSAMVKAGVSACIIVCISYWRYSKIHIVGAFINLGLFSLSGLLDLIVFCSTPKSVPYLADGFTADSIWFTTPFSNRHRLSVVLGRFILVFSATFATLCTSPPIYQLENKRNHDGLQKEQALYALMMIGSATPLITACLWISNQFRIMVAGASIRLAVGLLILGIAHRCSAQITSLHNGSNESFSQLPRDLSHQAVLMLRQLSMKAYLAGLCAYGDYVLCLITVWTRSKKWTIWSIYFIVPVICILTAQFTASALIVAEKSVFCRYNLIFGEIEGYPATSEFADDFCDAIANNPRLNGQHWLTSILVGLDILHLIHALLLCCNEKWQPAEWTAADYLLVRAIREDHSGLLKARTGAKLEEFVTTLRQRNVPHNLSSG